MRRLMKKIAFERNNDIRFAVATANAFQETAEVMLMNYFENKSLIKANQDDIISQ
jgi:tRNA(His) 5'-end guanylyltransferase